MSLDLHLLGGCSSSGSTLLAHLLDGLHDVRTGPELGAFHHRTLYADEGFPRELYRAFAGVAPGQDVTVEDLTYALIPSVFLMAREWYGMEGLDAEYDAFAASSNAAELFTHLKQQVARRQKFAADFCWIDQTPKNCVGALEFLQRFPEGRFVHVVRDGRDVMASLLRRYASEFPGHRDDIYLTVSLAQWLWDTEQALRASAEPGYLEVRYEDLVTHPTREVNRVLAHLGRPEVDEATLLSTPSPSAADDAALMRGGDKPTWTAHPTGPVSDRAVGRWRRELTREVLEGALALEFVPPGEQRALNLRRQLERLGYPYQLQAA